MLALALFLLAPAGSLSAADMPRTENIYVSGTDHIASSVAIARFEWTAAETVILAPAAAPNLVDVLAVVPLAGQEKAPILLVDGTMLDYRVMLVMRDFGVKRAIIAGAVDPEIALRLEELFPGIETEVLRGKNRIETAALINARIHAPRGTFVIGYNAAADAVSVASWAAAHAYTIQPANPDGSFSGEKYLSGYIVGGPALVRDIIGLERVYGPDRYATNQALLQALSYEHDIVYTADGQNLVEALLGAAAACRHNSPVLLAPNGGFAPADLETLAAGARVYAIRAE
jgi:putative cell wall-binding protein